MQSSTQDALGKDLLPDFKLAMRRLAATVTIISAWQDGRRFGMAATAVNSVTTTPPTLLVCVNRTASIHAPISADGRFCVNLLGAHHDELVPVFSGQASGEDRFAFGDWSQSQADPPYLLDAQASLLCKVVDGLTYGSHSVFIGEVQAIRLSGEPQPLIYHDGQLVRTAELRLPEVQ
jgi:flavin reductase (DIM6/NTAB) family NADH-FMN oxidoreductase RutF